MARKKKTSKKAAPKAAKKKAPVATSKRVDVPVVCDMPSGAACMMSSGAECCPIRRNYHHFVYHVKTFGMPAVDLLVRVYMWNVFWVSGKLKLDYYLNGNWDTAVSLYRDIHPLPLIPAPIAASVGTAAELILSLMLLIGLGGRVAALGLLGMTAVINYIFPESGAEQTIWALLLAVTLVHGSGKLSVDHLIKNKSCKTSCNS